MSDIIRTAGSQVPFLYLLRDAQGNLLIPSANPVQSIHASSADAASGANPLSGPVVLDGSAGVYRATFPASLTAGTYYLRTVSSLQTDVDDRLILQSISGSVSGGLLTLDDVKLQLRFPPGSTSQDAALQIDIDAATEVIERIKGPIIPRTYTAEQHDGGRTHVSLDRRPVLGLPTVTEYVGQTGYAITVVTNPATAGAYSALFDADAGVLTRLTSGGALYGWAEGRGNVQVTYTAGRAAVSPSVRKAAMHLIQWWWQGTQQGGRPSFNGGGTGSGGSGPVPAYAVPNFVYHLLEAGDGVRAPGIA